jgi:integrase
MCPSLFEQLEQWKNEYKENELNLVFPNDEGNYLDARNIVQRFFHPCLQQAGIKKIRWHDLRHTHISLLLNGGIAPKIAQYQAGHSSGQTTNDIYGHIMPSVYESSIDALDSILQKPLLRVVS